jgi:hypothetical protein
MFTGLKPWCRPSYAVLAVFLVMPFFLPTEGVAVERPAAPWPPRAGQLRVIIDTDAGSEIDDQYAPSLALGSPDRIRLEGIIAANFGETGGVAGISKSYEEIERVLAKAGLAVKYPVKRGLDPSIYRDITALVDPSAVRWEKTDSPAVTQDLRYDFTRNNGEIVRIYYVETGSAFNLLENALRRLER